MPATDDLLETIAADQSAEQPNKPGPAAICEEMLTENIDTPIEDVRKQVKAVWGQGKGFQTGQYNSVRDRLLRKRVGKSRKSKRATVPGDKSPKLGEVTQQAREFIKTHGSIERAIAYLQYANV